MRQDDALIMYRYAQHLAEGHGWVYNLGERHNGATSPLFTLLIAFFGRLSGTYLGAGHTISVLGIMATAIMVMEMLRRAGYGTGGLLSALLLLSSPLMIYTFGFETQLFLAFATAAALTTQLNGPAGAAVFFAALATLTRGDGVLLLAGVYGVYVWRARRLLWRPAMVAAGVALPWILYAWAAIGSPIPDTLGAKAAHATALDWPSFMIFRQARGTLRQFGFQQAYNLVPFGPAALGFWFAPIGPLLLAAWSGVQLLLYGWVNVNAYHWYLAPASLAAIVLAGVATGCVASWLPRRARLAPYIAGAAFVVLQVRASWAIRLGEHQHYVDIGRWLHDHARAGASVAALEVGALGWHSGVTVVDPLGLVTPATDHLKRKDFTWWLDERRPDFIILHRPLWAPIETTVAQHPSFRHYRELRRYGNDPDGHACVLYGR